MHPIFAEIEAVGFDLDRTLYADTPEMKRRILEEIASKILEFKPELRNTQRVLAMYRQRALAVRSWPKVFEEIGIDKPFETAAACVDRAGIADLIPKDPRLVEILKRLKEKFYLFLITGSIRKKALIKLMKIGIDPNLFSFALFGDDPLFAPKNDPAVFRYFLSQSAYAPREHVYAGDNVETDVRVPRTLGMKTIAVGAESDEADFCVATIHEIETLLL